MSSRRLQSSASQPADEHAQSARQSLDSPSLSPPSLSRADLLSVLFEMSNLLNTGTLPSTPLRSGTDRCAAGLDRQQLACAVALLEDGTSPEALAVRELEWREGRELMRV